MKVTTDGCLFGAIVAKEIGALKNSNLLDIGTGTGLLSLMAAQANEELIIDAIEIDEQAAEQANENVAVTKWSNRITILQADILEYQLPVLYDVIISNPPFYEQQLSSPNEHKNLAHHASKLTFQQLFGKAKKLLQEAGIFYVLVPFYRTDEVITVARTQSLFLEKKWLIQQSSMHSFFRTVCSFKMSETEMYAPSEITIRDEAGNYTQAFTELLQPFYLKL